MNSWQGQVQDVSCESLECSRSLTRPLRGQAASEAHDKRTVLMRLSGAQPLESSQNGMNTAWSIALLFPTVCRVSRVLHWKEVVFNFVGDLAKSYVCASTADRFCSEFAVHWRPSAIAEFFSCFELLWWRMGHDEDLFDSYQTSGWANTSRALNSAALSSLRVHLQLLHWQLRWRPCHGCSCKSKTSKSTGLNSIGPSSTQACLDKLKSWRCEVCHGAEPATRSGVDGWMSLHSWSQWENVVWLVQPFVGVEPQAMASPGTIKDSPFHLGGLESGWSALLQRSADSLITKQPHNSSGLHKDSPLLRSQRSRSLQWWGTRTQYYFPFTQLNLQQKLLNDVKDLSSYPLNLSDTCCSMGMDPCAEWESSRSLRFCIEGGERGSALWVKKNGQIPESQYHFKPFEFVVSVYPALILCYVLRLPSALGRTFRATLPDRCMCVFAWGCEVCEQIYRSMQFRRSSVNQYSLTAHLAMFSISTAVGFAWRKLEPGRITKVLLVSTCTNLRSRRMHDRELGVALGAPPTWQFASHSMKLNLGTAAGSQSIPNPLTQWKFKWTQLDCRKLVHRSCPEQCDLLLLVSVESSLLAALLWHPTPTRQNVPGVLARVQKFRPKVCLLFCSVLHEYDLLWSHVRMPFCCHVHVHFCHPVQRWDVTAQCKECCVKDVTTLFTQATGSSRGALTQLQPFSWPPIHLWLWQQVRRQISSMQKSTKATHIQVRFWTHLQNTYRHAHMHPIHVQVYHNVCNVRRITRALDATAASQEHPSFAVHLRKKMSSSQREHGDCLHCAPILQKVFFSRKLIKSFWWLHSSTLVHGINGWRVYWTAFSLWPLGFLSCTHKRGFYSIQWTPKPNPHLLEREFQSSLSTFLVGDTRISSTRLGL